MSMTHDITHCEGIGCKRRDKCHRYLAHLEAVRLKLNYLTYRKIDDVNNCDMFWEE